MKRQILVRLLLSVLTLMVVAIASFEELSLNYRMVKDGGVPAQLSLWALTILAITAIADTLVNDCLPEKYTLKWANKHRYLIWACMGVTYAGYSFVLSKMDLGPWLALTFLVYGIGCSTIAFMDLRYRATAVEVDSE